MALVRMDHVGVVVEDLKAAKAFFTELGLELVGEGPVSGDWVDGTVGLDGVEVEIAFMRVPGGNGQIELTRFVSPKATTAEPAAPANTIGIRRMMFAVTDIEDTVARLRTHGAELFGEIATYVGGSAANGLQEASYRMCYVRGPEGVIVALAEEF